MFVEEVTYENYLNKVPAKIFFNQAQFNNLNRNKVDSVRYFLFKEKKYRFGLCVGQDDNSFFAPFSAPFATFINLRDDWSILQLEDAIKIFEEFSLNAGIKYLRFILPPSFYAESLISATQNIFIRLGYVIKYQDLNFSVRLDKNFLDNYLDRIPSNGRKNLINALKNNLSLHKCETFDEKKLAYEIIKANRLSRGYPLKMTWEQVIDTIKIVEHEFFIVSHNDENIAAAMIFHVTEDIVQVIYWGDIPKFSALRPMNFLAYKLMNYYSEKNFKYIDVGPSTEFGVPNYGLCDFKRSVGLNVNAKFTFEKFL